MAFNIGDRVIIKCNNPRYNGQTGIVSVIRTQRTYVILDKWPKSSALGFYHKDVELVANMQKSVSKSDDDFLKELGLIDDFEAIRPQSKPMKLPNAPQRPQTMFDAYMLELNEAKPKYTGQALAWHKEGKCPHCGELGRYSMSVAICSKHGNY